MGTFHHDKGDLHGITVAVDTKGPTLFIGRCDVMDERRIVLVDVDVHEEGADGRSKQEYLERAALVGVWKKHDRVVIPLDQVRWIRPLGEFGNRPGTDAHAGEAG
jgi:hypothetical protein